MEVWILFGTFVFLLLIGTPVAFCLGVASFATVLYLGLPPVVVFQRLNSGVSVFALMAIPFFIFAGELMVRGDIARRLVALAGAMVGHMRGGLGRSTSRLRCCLAAFPARPPPMRPRSAG
jgi:TRAP-type mannitol/chloroaromatic compound transport system permease large subunit